VVFTNQCSFGMHRRRSQYRIHKHAAVTVLEGQCRWHRWHMAGRDIHQYLERSIERPITSQQPWHASYGFPENPTEHRHSADAEGGRRSRQNALLPQTSDRQPSISVKKKHKSTTMLNLCSQQPHCPQIPPCRSIHGSAVAPLRRHKHCSLRR
jgi:hypothetical protein